MTTWLIIGGAILGSWAMLSVVGGELVRRSAELQQRGRRRSHAE